MRRARSLVDRRGTCSVQVSRTSSAQSSPQGRYRSNTTPMAIHQRPQIVSLTASTPIARNRDTNRKPKTYTANPSTTRRDHPVRRWARTMANTGGSRGEDGESTADRRKRVVLVRGRRHRLEHVQHGRDDRARRHEDVADLPRREGVPAQPVAGGRHSSQAQTAVAQQPSATTNIN